MKCPKCSAELVKQVRHNLEVNSCPQDHGMWLEFNELDELEDEVFDVDAYKGTLIFSDSITNFHCPQCNALLKQFQYRLYDLTLEYCDKMHGFWLDAGEDDRVLELMAEQKRNARRKLAAEGEWKEERQEELDKNVEWKLHDLIANTEKDLRDLDAESHFKLTMMKLRSKSFFSKLTTLRK